MSSRSKGTRIRRKLIDKLEATGWRVGVCERTGRFIKEKDLFGLFDLVAIKDGHVRFVQVTTNRPHSHKLYIDFAREHASDYVSIEQWVWIDHSGFKTRVY